jgi:hypothetical protein
MNHYSIFLLLIFSVTGLLEAKAQTDLHGVTFGFGTGYNLLNKNSNSYSLSIDSSHALKMQKLSRNSFVISSALSIKSSKLKVDEHTNKLLKANSADNTNHTADFKDRLSINVSLNLLEINSDNIFFNKNIDGGLGFGYFLNEHVQLSLFYDLVCMRHCVTI